MKRDERRREIIRRLAKYGLGLRQTIGLIKEIEERSSIIRLARDACDNGIPKDQGPVWFGDEAWKTSFWQGQWEIQKAYREGEEVRTRFGSEDENPYYRRKPPLSSHQITLECAWRRGFKGETI